MGKVCVRAQSFHALLHVHHPPGTSMCSPTWKSYCSRVFISQSPAHSEKTMATHSSTLAWKIPWTEEPGRLQSMGLLGVGHYWATSLSLSCIGEGNGNPLQCSCLENPRDRGAWWAAIYGVTQSWTRLKRLSSSSSSSSSLLLLEVWVRGCNFPLCNQVFGLSTDESESASCSVVSNSLWPHGL